MKFKLFYVLGVSLLLVGIRIVLFWAPTSRWEGAAIIAAAITILAYAYLKDSRHRQSDISGLSIHMAVLGLALILVDVAYNVYEADGLGPFDIGMVCAGFAILTLNLGLGKFLKLTVRATRFITIFIFLTMVFYGFAFEGVSILFGVERGLDEFLIPLTGVVASIAASILSLVGPASVNGAVVDFGGLEVSVGYACSGVESITVFAAAILSYFVALGDRNLPRILKYLGIGICALFTLNILRMVLIIAVGRYVGVESMFFVHYHLGWVFFVVAMSIFWYLVLDDPQELDFIEKGESG